MPSQKNISQAKPDTFSTSPANIVQATHLQAQTSSAKLSHKPSYKPSQKPSSMPSQKSSRDHSSYKVNAYI
jgi:hypothetical protein